MRAFWLKSAISAITVMVAASICAPAKAASERFVFLEPQRDTEGRAITQRLPDGRELPVARPLREGELTARLRTAVASGAAELLPMLDAKARALSRQATDCPQLGTALIVFLSDEDGGFARKDFLLSDGSGRTTLCADYFIDLTVDQKSIDNGEFEEVLAHEYGHVLLRRLLGPIPPTMSRNAHSILTITDPVTAFDEGFGEHFQPIAVGLTQNPGFTERVRNAGTAPADFWLSRRETWLREIGVPHGDFRFDHVPVTAGLTGIDLWRAAQTDYSRDPCRLQSGEAMVASEGVAANFFYRLLGSDTQPAALLARYERLMIVLAEMGRWESRAPLIDLVSRWIARYPDDRERILRLFLEATSGATVSEHLKTQAQALSCQGARGRLEQFVPALRAYRATVDETVNALVKGALTLDAALAPELWLAAPDQRIPASPWSDELTEPLVIDLNTADQASLEYLLRGDRKLAGRILAARSGKGFANLEDAARRARLDKRQLAQLVAMADAATRLPAFKRQ